MAATIGTISSVRIEEHPKGRVEKLSPEEVILFLKGSLRAHTHSALESLGQSECEPSNYPLGQGRVHCPEGAV